MKEPRRLIDAGRGLGSELLSAASRELAPERVRASVRKSVDMALAGVAAGGAGGSASGGSTSGDVGTLLGSAGTQPSAALAVWGKLGAALKASTLVPIGAVALAGAGVVGVLQLRSTSEGAPAVVAPSVSPAAPSAPPAPKVYGELEAPNGAVESLSALPAIAAESSARSDSASSTATARSALSGPPRQTSAAPSNANLQTNARRDDLLGEQLEKLRDARLSLEAGNPDRALRLLDEYARSFPGGTLAPEAALLLRKAHEAKARARRGGLPQ